MDSVCFRWSVSLSAVRNPVLSQYCVWSVPSEKSDRPEVFPCNVDVDRGVRFC